MRLLLQGTKLPWQAIHIAGTNGKGSVCAYLSAMLREANIRTGRFTSPHLIDRWDCISIDDKPVSESIFRQAEDGIKSQNEARSIQATPFELLTATAFLIFKQQQVQVGVVECGMGGRLDSTNVLQHPLVTVITSVGLDHQAFLGNTLAEIAREKAGIMKSASPCVAEFTNDSAVVETLTQVAQNQAVDIYLNPVPEWFADAIAAETSNKDVQFLLPDSNPDSFTSVRLRNQWLAYQAITLALPAFGMASEFATSLLPAMVRTKFPGRFQRISLRNLTGRSTDALLDGAHNKQAMKSIDEYRTRLLIGADGHSAAESGKRCTWLIACSSTKGDIFRIANNDHVIITEFGPVDGMPWVLPTPAEDVLSGRPEANIGARTVRKRDVLEALKCACEIANEGPMIITGSLYLVSDVLRLLRTADGEGWPVSCTRCGANETSV